MTHTIHADLATAVDRLMERMRDLARQELVEAPDDWETITAQITAEDLPNALPGAEFIAQSGRKGKVSLVLVGIELGSPLEVYGYSALLRDYHERSLAAPE